MKKYLLFFGFFSVIVACSLVEKGHDNHTTTKNTEQLLIEKTWKADEIRVQLSDNTTTYYKRGLAGSTYDSDSIKFSANGDGTYYFEGTDFPITWGFSDSAKTKLTIDIDQPPAPFKVHLENIHITSTFFKYSQYSSAGGISYMASCTRVPN